VGGAQATYRLPHNGTPLEPPFHFVEEEGRRRKKERKKKGGEGE